MTSAELLQHLRNEERAAAWIVIFVKMYSVGVQLLTTADMSRK